MEYLPPFILAGSLYMLARIYFELEGKKLTVLYELAGASFALTALIAIIKMLDRTLSYFN